MVSYKYFTFVLLSFFLVTNSNSTIIFKINQNSVWYRWGFSEHRDIITKPALKSLGWENELAIWQVYSSDLCTDILDQVGIVTGIYCSVIDPIVNDNDDVCANKDIVNSIVKTSFFNHYPLPLESNEVNDHTKGFHFDNLFTYNIIQDRWRDLKKWITEEGNKNKNNFDVMHWLSMMGVVLHAIQDFYCHSNWVILTAYYGCKNKSLDPKELPTWEEIDSTEWRENHSSFNYKSAKSQFELSNIRTVEFEFKKEGEGFYLNGGLQTGRWGDYNASNNPGIKPWQHRHPGNIILFKRRRLIVAVFQNENAYQNEYDAAIGLSIRASKWWINFMTDKKIIGEENAIKINSYARTHIELQNPGIHIMLLEDSEITKGDTDETKFEKPDFDSDYESK